ncbi:hypothetical protein RRG08_050344 [Elysia crispata]|uniref:CCDC144C-like coiled-coil domain-containing protein n=1 Tax=Elysia crispata TaxID=231223 RepID=A0AAE1CLX6_9GAST|nr:hypothetical protein RRG08_050344 [Elysia crispata]
MSNTEETASRPSKSLLRTRFGWFVDRPSPGSSSAVSRRVNNSSTQPGEEIQNTSTRPSPGVGRRNARDAFAEASKSARNRFGFSQRSSDNSTSEPETVIESKNSTKRPHWRYLVYPRTNPRVSSSLAPVDNQTYDSDSTSYCTVSVTKTEEVLLAKSDLACNMDCGSIESVPHKLSPARSLAHVAVPRKWDSDPIVETESVRPGNPGDYEDLGDANKSVDVNLEDPVNIKQEDSVKSSSDALRVSEEEDTCDTLGADNIDDSDDGSAGITLSSSSSSSTDSNSSSDPRHAQTHQMTSEEQLAVRQCSRRLVADQSFSSIYDFTSTPPVELPTIAEVTEPSHSESETSDGSHAPDDSRCTKYQRKSPDLMVTQENLQAMIVECESHSKSSNRSISKSICTLGETELSKVEDVTKNEAAISHNSLYEDIKVPAGFFGYSNKTEGVRDEIYQARPYLISRGKIWLQQPAPDFSALLLGHQYEEETTSFIGKNVPNKVTKNSGITIGPAPKLNVAKFAQSIHISESETEGESGRDSTPKVKTAVAGVKKDGIQTKTTFTPAQASKRQTSWQSQTSGEDNSWGDSPVTPRKNSATRVSFKTDEELSEVHDITVTESEPESEGHELPHQKSGGARSGQSMVSNTAKAAENAASYVPSANTGANVSSPSQEKMQALMKELGLSDVDDVSDVSDEEVVPPPALPKSPPPKAQVNPAADSDWDTSVMSDIMTTPRPGILKKWSNAGLSNSGEADKNASNTSLGVQESPKQQAKTLLRAPAIESGDESSAWDTTEADKIQVPDVSATAKAGGTAQRADSISEWDSDIEEMMNPTTPQPTAGTTPTPPPPPLTAAIPKEVEAIVRQKQAEQDSEKEEDEEDDLGGSGEIAPQMVNESAHFFVAKGKGKADSDDDDWDSTVDSVTHKSNAGLQYKEVNIDAPESYSERIPVVQSSMPLSDAQVPINAAPESSPSKTQTGVGGKGDDDSDDWDSENEDRTDSGSPAAPVYLPGVGGIGGGVATDQGSVATAEVIEKQLASPQRAAAQMVPDSEEDDESESMSSWELHRKAERQAKRLVQADAEEERRKEEEARIEEQRKQREEEERQEERLKKKREEQEAEAREAEMLRAQEERKRIEEEQQRQRDRELEEEREKRAQEAMQWQLEAEEEERKKQEELQLQWEAEEEERKRREELQQQWEAEEEVKAQLMRQETQKMLESEAHEMEEDLLMKPEEAVETGDYLFAQQQELNRIDEQFQRERAEREKREEEEEKQRRQREEEALARQEVIGEEMEQASSQMTSAPPPAISPRPVNNPGMRPSPAPQPSAQTSTYVNLSNSTVDQIRQRLQVPAPSAASPSSTLGFSTQGAFLSSGQGLDGFDDNESILSENPGEDRPGISKSYYHGMYRPNDPLDDDALSYTSTEFEDPVQSTPNYAKDRDLIASVNIGDPSSMLKVQEHVRDTRRQLEQERNQRQVLENKVKVTNKEKAELTKKLDNLVQQKSALEQGKLDLEARIRSLEYSVSEEEEKRKNAEILLEKTKEQLARKESQFASELDAKQKAELTMRNLQIEMRTNANTIKELEEEKEELQRQVSHATNARLLQEQINEDQQKLLHAQTLQQQSMTPRESDNQDLEQTGDNDKLRAEVYALQMEMERQRSRFKDEVAMMSAENEELQSKVEELKNDIKLNEEALAHATMQYNMQVASLRSDLTTATSNSDRERSGREKVEAELESIKTRLVAANHEMDKMVRARNELERDYRREKDSWSRELDRKDAEVTSVKDNLQHTSQRLQTTEAKLNSMENEMHVSNTSLMERTAQLQQLRQDLDRTRIAHETLDQNYRIEKEQGAKLQAKIENTQEKLSNQQHENLSLRQQLDSLKLSGGGLPGSDANEKLNNILSNLRAESDRAKASLEEKNSTLLENMARLKEEARGSEVRRAGLEADLRRLQEEHSDLVRRAASAEASLQVASKAKEHLEQERAALKAELDQAQQRYQTAHDKATEAQARVSELLDRLDKAESSSVYSTQQLVNTSANMQGLFKSKSELDESMQQIQVENARLEAELKYEKQRADMLYQDLQDSQKVRSSLEALCANLKSTSAHLEDRLGSEENGFEDSRLDIADLERNKQTSESKLGEEKNRAESANHEKKSLESRLDVEIDKNRQLQKDVNTLKAHLKAAKTKIKDMGGSSPRPGDPQYSDFRRDVNNLETFVSTPRHHQGLVSDAGGDVRSELEAKYRAELNRKLSDVNRFLESQSHLQGKLDTSRTEIEVNLMADKRKLEEENKNLRVRYEQAVAQRETKELEARRFKELYESEMKWRLRVSDQLQLATEKSFNLTSKLNNERHHRNRLTSNIGNLQSTILLNNSFDTATARGAGTGIGMGSTNGFQDDELSNKIRSELDKSIARHLEAAPHDHNRPILRSSKDPPRFSSALTQASHDYIEILKRKYCV